MMMMLPVLHVKQDPNNFLCCSQRGLVDLRLCLREVITRLTLFGSSGTYRTFLLEMAMTFRLGSAEGYWPDHALPYLILSEPQFSSIYGTETDTPLPLPEHLPWYSPHLLWPTPVLNQAQKVTNSQYVRCQQTHRQEELSPKRTPLTTDLPSGAEGRRQMVLGLDRPTAKSRRKKAAL